MATYILRNDFKSSSPSVIPAGTTTRDLTLREFVELCEIEGHLSVMQNIADGFWPVMCKGVVRYFSRETDLMRVS